MAQSPNTNNYNITALFPAVDCPWILNLLVNRTPQPAFTPLAPIVVILNISPVLAIWVWVQSALWGTSCMVREDSHSTFSEGSTPHWHFQFMIYNSTHSHICTYPFISTGLAMNSKIRNPTKLGDWSIQIAIQTHTVAGGYYSCQ